MDDLLQDIADLLESVNRPGIPQEEMLEAIEEALDLVYAEEDEGEGDGEEEDGDEEEDEEEGAEEPPEIPEEEGEPGTHGVHV